MKHIFQKSSYKNPAVIFDKEVYNYKDLSERINNLSVGLSSIGIKSGDHIAILLSNCPEFIISFFANWQIGAISVPLDTRLNIEELNRIFKKLRITALITNTRLLSLLQKKHIKLKYIMVKGDPASKEYISLDKILHKETGASFKTLPETKILCQLSSGSTGPPKFIYRTGKSLLQEAKNFSSGIALCPKDRVLCVLPLVHSYALCTIMLSSLYSGASFFLEQEFLPHKILELIQQNRITIFPANPFIYEILAKIYQDKKFNLDSLRLCISGGAPLREETFSKFRRLYNKAISQLYGLTEVGAVAINYPFNSNKIDSVGKPLVRGKVKVHRGEILLGDLKSGDLGKIDKDGYLYIQGRKNDIINVAGSKIYSQEVEKVILSHPSVREAVVLGVDYEYGQLVKAFVVQEGKIKAEELINYCKRSLSQYKIPRIIEFRKELPKTVTGKIARNRLKKSLCHTVK